jgi:hypothetical protein
VLVYGARSIKPKVWQQLLAIKGEAKAVDPVFRSRKGGGALDVSQVRRIVYAAAAKPARRCRPIGCATPMPATRLTRASQA